MELPAIGPYKLPAVLLEAVSDGIIIYQNPGPILWCNQQAAQILQTVKEYLLGSNIKVYFPWLSGGEKKSDLPLKTLEIVLQESPQKVSAVIFSPVLPPVKNAARQTGTADEINPTVTNQTDLRKPKYTFEQIIGENSNFIEIKEMAQRAASSLSPVLIYGDTGTGKELFAQSIHNAGTRTVKPFIAVNCAAIPETLLEAILFGTIQGAFTGAINRPGLFEQASEGTLFLDEVNSMPLSLQAKLLRVIQEGSLRRVGGVKDIPVNPRIISSVNIEPFKAIENDMLRSDLFYRLGVVCLPIPPLRERKDDLPLLIDYFTDKISRKLNKHVTGIAPVVLEVLTQYDWPGNVRQLEHAFECAINLLDDGEEIHLEHFPDYLKFVTVASPETYSHKPKTASLKNEVEKTERSKIITTLEETRGNINQAAKKLGISRQSLYYRMRKLQIMVNRS